MNKEDFEKWYINFKQKGAIMFAFKEKNEEYAKIKYMGSRLEVLFLFEEIVRELNKKVDKQILDYIYEEAFKNEESINE